MYQFVFFTGGVVFLTLIINGSTTQFLVHYLNMDQISETKSRVLEYAKYDMYSKALESFEELGEDEELGPADWTTVCKYVSCLKRVPEEGRPAHPHHPPTSTALPEIEERMQQMLDTRIRFLNGVQSAYWTMLEEGRITQTAAILLMQSVDEAQDKVHNEHIILSAVYQ
jgi:NhaP-type Na+/H+ or K+/H+ antiporter